MAKRDPKDGDTVIIKKYANRRLYNTSSSSYITLDDLSKMTRDGTDFKVVDAKTGDDITHSILTQIIMEEEASGEHMLPVSFLRELISMYGNSMQSVMPHYLEAAMTNFRANQSKLHDAFRKGIGTNPLAKLAETNIAIMRAATQAFIPDTAKPDDAEEPAKKDELAALREQMAAMQKKLDELGS
ncbi:polyhydroxyalkanoate synthesis repressor PhaR [Altererythrobacter confluentis]|uniref:Polyhydroxyalkanoate synthesis repressor PhaR n=1 Tax=Allopontixanthobacter confluentis TaxID=1849021 RepID=A0A6L7GDI7_9SPHN|nr:polyhydroxyalkanoate synthesis repressor PhaR [Allopontixanthobacter confluentis]MXP14093.1 polyhydroxyalkanoate synthesis repressor PhaR [Allopontixanthobacter confluentis]